ncbi:hypothetical protein NPS01_13240 [Nocardioides psychrotolerans]|nr:hypothetical protein [Nocardioides psychrotolerans]GEP37661.1 hypothetical protein NPS01_13240 [Nocardioides psychrotolerans]
MTKLMFALWGDDLSAALHSPDLRAALAAAGAERLQVNLDDEHVAAAMRIPTGDRPIGAVVSVWTSGPSAVVVSALEAVARDASGHVAGWEVEERRPIGPPETWDGSRGAGLANVAVLRRPDELSQEEWLHRWLVDHTPIAIATQATFGYLQNVVVEAVTPDAPVVHALVEELFPIEGMTDMHAFYGSGGDDAELSRRLELLMGSVTRIGADRDIDLVPTSRYLYALS